jgi:hypothetical protein
VYHRWFASEKAMIVKFSRLVLQTLDLQFPYGKMIGQGRLLKVLILTFFPSPKSQIAPSNFFLESELYRVFFRPLSVQASDQLSDLLGIINDKDWNQNQSDSWTYSWGPSFSTKKSLFPPTRNLTSLSTLCFDLDIK